ncbi:MAG: ABC transporter permease, partial [Verrucomicrobiota bacterium]
MSHFFPQLGWELFRLAARRRTWLGFGLFLAVEIIFLVIFTSKRSQDGMRRFFETMSGSFEDYFSALTVGFMIMAFTLFLLSAISVALVAGDILAKESEDGNLRIILSRPVSRFQLLLVKYCACHIYATTLCFFVAVTAFLVGTIDR